MHYSTRLQIQQEAHAKTTRGQFEAMARQANELKLEGKFPHVADAMTKFLQSCLPTPFPRSAEDAQGLPASGFRAR